MRVRIRAMLCALVVVVISAGALRAQGAGDFQPIDENAVAAEQLPAAPMVMAAYGLVWLVLVGYVWSLRRRQARVELEMAALRSRVSERP